MTKNKRTAGSHVKSTAAGTSKKHKPLYTSIDERYFPSTESRVLFEEACATKNIRAERQVKEKLLLDLGWKYIDTLKEWGWWNFILRDFPIYSNAVRAFYFFGDNKMYDDDGNPILGRGYTDEFRTSVFGEDMRIHTGTIRDYIGDKTRGGELHIPSDFNYVTACQAIYERPDLGAQKNTIIDLTIHNRILHLVVCQVLNPRTGSFTKLTQEDMYWMYKIIRKEKIDLSAKIVARMITSLKASRTVGGRHVFQHAKLVSEIIHDKCSIPKGEFVDKKCKMAPLDKGTIHGWEYDEEAKEWRRKKDDDDEPATHQGESSSSASPSVGSILDELRLMHVTNQERFDKLDKGMEEIVARQIAIEKRQATIEDHYKSLNKET